jgi:hypothetical protein
VWITAPWTTGSFGKSDRKVGTGIDGTLEKGLVVVSVHPKIAGIATELIRGPIKAAILTVVLRREQTTFRGGDVVTGHKKMYLSAILAEKSPTNEAKTGHSGRSVDSLNLAGGAFLERDKIVPIGCD